MITNTNDGSGAAPRMRLDINGSNIFGLPESSSMPKGDARAILEAVKAAGFEGVQTGSKAELCRELGLRVTGSGRINSPEEADRHASDAKAAGYDCYTVHVGWGMEDDDEVNRLVEAVLRASEKHGVPIYIETHRATITQDMWRTVQIVKRFPEVRFNGDFSHYYTGQEMVYGGVEAKWEFMAPIFERVRFIHARIGNPGCMQVAIGDEIHAQAVEHFREMWTRSFVGFLKSAGAGDVICFTPELLGSSNFYARVFKDSSEKYVEESDRWEQAQRYGEIARKCWDEARKRAGRR